MYIHFQLLKINVHQQVLNNRYDKQRTNINEMDIFEDQVLLKQQNYGQSCYYRNYKFYYHEDLTPECLMTQYDK